MKTFIGIVFSMVTQNMYFSEHIHQENKTKHRGDASGNTKLKFELVK